MTESDPTADGGVPWTRQATDPISARRQRVIGCDRTLEVVGFHAGDQANLFQGRKLLLGFGGIPQRQIELTEVLMRAAVTAIEHDGVLVILHRRPELTQPAIGIADVVVDVGIAWVAQ